MPRNLKKPLDERGEYLPDGWSTVEVMSYTTIESKKKTPGIEYILRDELGREEGIAFWLTDAAAIREASFAKAAGCTDSCLEAFESDDLIGKSVDVFKEKKEGQQWPEITKWATVGTKAGAQSERPTPTPVRKPAGIAEHSDPLPEDDIPF